LGAQSEHGNLRAAGARIAESDPSVDWTQLEGRKRAGFGPCLAVPVVLLVLFAAGPARAAGSGATPDPAPTSGAPSPAPAATSANAPAPDPAPQAGTVTPHLTQSSTAGSVVEPSGGGLAVGQSQVASPKPATAGSLTIQTPTAVPVRRSRPGAHSLRARGGEVRLVPFTVAPMLAPIRGVLSHLARLTALRAVVSNHDGWLLLFSGLALGMLAIASAAMLRLLARLGKEEWLR
jgi:hypothetical protein